MCEETNKQQIFVCDLNYKFKIELKNNTVWLIVVIMYLQRECT